MPSDTSKTKALLGRIRQSPPAKWVIAGTIAVTVASGGLIKTLLPRTNTVTETADHAPLGDTTRTDTPIVEDYSALLNGHKLDDTFEGIEQNRDATLIIRYTFDDRRDFSVTSKGQKDYRPCDSTERKLFVEEMFPKVSEVCNVKFVEANSPAEAYLRIVTANLREYKSDQKKENLITLAYSYLPNAQKKDQGCPIVMGDSTAINRKRYIQTGLHEIGHALGLSHPVAYQESDDDKRPQLRNDLDDFLSSVMSYNMAKQGMPESYMGHDIQALQHLYGKPLNRPLSHSLTETSGVRTIPPKDTATEKVTGALWWKKKMKAQPSLDTLQINDAKKEFFVSMVRGRDHPSQLGSGSYTYNMTEPFAAVNKSSSDAVISANDHANYIEDGNGNSRIFPAKGDDIIKTGGGQDSTYVRSGDGRDTFKDFNPKQDRLLFGGGITRFSIKEQPYGSRVDFYEHKGRHVYSARLEGVKKRELTKASSIVAANEQTLEELVSHDWQDLKDRRHVIPLACGIDLTLKDFSTDTYKLSFPTNTISHFHHEATGKHLEITAIDTLGSEYCKLRLPLSTDPTLIDGKDISHLVTVEKGYKRQDGLTYFQARSLSDSSAAFLDARQTDGPANFWIDQSAATTVVQPGRSKNFLSIGNQASILNKQSGPCTLDLYRVGKGCAVERFDCAKDSLKPNADAKIVIVDGSAVIKTGISWGNILYIDQVKGNLAKVETGREFTIVPLKELDQADQDAVKAAIIDGKKQLEEARQLRAERDKPMLAADDQHHQRADSTTRSFAERYTNKQQATHVAPIER